MNQITLHNLPSLNHKKRKRVGRGVGAGIGKTCGRGTKGQHARSGTNKPRIGFEGGQTIWFRRLPKRGANSFKQRFFAKNMIVFNSDYIIHSWNENESIQKNWDKLKLNHKVKKIKIVAGKKKQNLKHPILKKLSKMENIQLTKQLLKHNE